MVTIVFVIKWLKKLFVWSMVFCMVLMVLCIPLEFMLISTIQKMWSSTLWCNKPHESRNIQVCQSLFADHKTTLSLQKYYPTTCNALFQWSITNYLGAGNGILLSINVSHNFVNSSHYNSLDYGPSIVMWVMDDDVSTHCDQYLIFHNIVQIDDGWESKEGVMIKICDGMLMSFQGNTLHHGTTICQNSITGELTLYCNNSSICT